MEGHIKLFAHLLRTFVCGIQPVRGQFTFGLKDLFVPFYRVTAGNQCVVVLTELSERYEDLSVVQDLCYPVPDGQDLILGLTVDNVSVLE